MTKIEIIDETVAYYAANKRGVIENGLGGGYAVSLPY